MSYEIKIENLLTTFLGLSETQIDSGQSIMKTNLVKRAKVPSPNLNITALGYSNGNNLFELVVDHDKNDQVITQRTYVPNVSTVFNTLKNDAPPDKYGLLGINVFELYIPNLKNRARFKIVDINGIDWIQADVYL